MRQLFSVNLLKGLPLVRRPSPRSGVALPLVLAGEEAAAQRAPGTNSDSQFLRGRDVFALDVALDERVFQLQRRDAFLALLLGQRLRARHIPGGSVGESVMADLAGAHQIGERQTTSSTGVTVSQACSQYRSTKSVFSRRSDARWRGKYSCGRCRPNWDCRANR